MKIKTALYVMQQYESTEDLTVIFKKVDAVLLAKSNSLSKISGSQLTHFSNKTDESANKMAMLLSKSTLRYQEAFNRYEDSKSHSSAIKERVVEASVACAKALDACESVLKFSCKVEGGLTTYADYKNNLPSLQSLMSGPFENIANHFVPLVNIAVIERDLVVLQGLYYLLEQAVQTKTSAQLQLLENIPHFTKKDEEITRKLQSACMRAIEDLEISNIDKLADFLLYKLLPLIENLYFLENYLRFSVLQIIKKSPEKFFLKPMREVYNTFHNLMNQTVKSCIEQVASLRRLGKSDENLEMQLRVIQAVSDSPAQRIKEMLNTEISRYHAAMGLFHLVDERFMPTIDPFEFESKKEEEFASQTPGGFVVPTIIFPQSKIKIATFVMSQHAEILKQLKMSAPREKIKQIVDEVDDFILAENARLEAVSQKLNMMLSDNLYEGSNSDFLEMVVKKSERCKAAFDLYNKTKEAQNELTDTIKAAVDFAKELDMSDALLKLIYKILGGIKTYASCNDIDTIMKTSSYTFLMGMPYAYVEGILDNIACFASIQDNLITLKKMCAQYLVPSLRADYIAIFNKVDAENNFFLTKEDKDIFNHMICNYDAVKKNFKMDEGNISDLVSFLIYTVLPLLQHFHTLHNKHKMHVICLILINPVDIRMVMEDFPVMLNLYAQIDYTLKPCELSIRAFEKFGRNIKDLKATLSLLNESCETTKCIVMDEDIQPFEKGHVLARYIVESFEKANEILATTIDTLLPPVESPEAGYRLGR